MQTLQFKTAAEFRVWLGKNHTNAEGIWLRIYKKASGRPTVTYADALDEALCHGWIDGLKKSYDELSWIQKFTQRRAKSGWSKINTQHVERLTKAGLMLPPGLAAVEAAKADGRWAAAYSSPRDANVPEDFLRAVAKNRKMKAFFDSLSRANIYAIVYRLQTAKKPETRARRMQLILEKFRRGEKFH